MKPSHPSQLPTIPLNQGGLHSLDSVIAGYLPHLVRKQPAPRRTIAVLREIRRKLAPHLKPDAFPIGTALHLSGDELYALDLAIQGFSTLLQRRIPPSSDRDATIAELEQLHQYCHSLLSSN